MAEHLAPQSQSVITALMGTEGLCGARAGLRIGLFGGSFNPAHDGHLDAAMSALTALRLDCIWWLVSPQNPLKSESGMAPFEVRLASARAMAQHPRMVVTGIEERLGTRITAHTVKALKTAFPKARFVWIMGGDSWVDFVRWNRWRDIVGEVPVAILARPGRPMAGRASPAALKLAQARKLREHAPWLAFAKPPAWIFLNMPHNALSATKLRARKLKRGGSP